MAAPLKLLLATASRRSDVLAEVEDDSFTNRMPTSAIPLIGMLGMLAVLVAATRVRLAGQIGVSGWIMVAAILASAGPVLDWDPCAGPLRVLVPGRPR